MGLSLVGGGEERYERRRLKKASRTKAVDAVVSFVGEKGGNGPS